MCNDIHCNDRLYHWGIKDTQACDVCNLAVKQTPKHLFYECVKANKIWRQIVKFFDYCEIQEYQMEYCNIILNDVCKPSTAVANLVVMIAKQCIFANKCLGKELSISQVLLKVEEVQEVELIKARRTGKIVAHYKKWQQIYPSYKAKVIPNSNHMEEYIVNYIDEI